MKSNFKEINIKYYTNKLDYNIELSFKERNYVIVKWLNIEDANTIIKELERVVKELHE